MEPSNKKLSADEPVRIIGVMQDDNNNSALRKIARACIALAKEQLAQERRQEKSGGLQTTAKADNV